MNSKNVFDRRTQECTEIRSREALEVARYVSVLRATAKHVVGGTNIEADLNVAAEKLESLQRELMDCDDVIWCLKGEITKLKGDI